MAKFRHISNVCGLRDLEDGRRLCRGELQEAVFTTYDKYVVQCSKCKSNVSGPTRIKQEVRDAYPQRVG